MENLESNNTILKNLMLNSHNESEESSGNFDLKCLKCDEIFQFPQNEDEYLAHLYLSHRLVIADVGDIANLKDYLLYWIKEFENVDLDHYCTTMLLDQLPDGTPAKNEKFYLLSDILPKDYEIRKKLHVKRLQEVLAQYQFERSDTSFTRDCLHCRDTIKGTRADFLEHLYNKHFIQLGKPENLVFIDELIETVQQKLENLVCLYCEKTFKDRSTLKEHMRKKGHKRINPEIKFYDKFFLMNYKTEKPIRTKNFNQDMIVNTIKKDLAKNHENNKFHTNRVNLSDNDDSDWSDWEGEKVPIKCLFCLFKDSEYENIKDHMIKEHELNFDEHTKSLNFYEKIKVVNFVRRQMHILECIKCMKKFSDSKSLEDHLKAEKHYTLGEKVQWNKPEYFFPTYEDDEMLCHLDDESNEFEKSPVEIYSEDTLADSNEAAEKLSLENFALSVSKLF